MRARVFAILFVVSALHAQPLVTEISQTKFNSGQNVVPVYEGWIKNADGTFSFVFGYFNRNWKEEVAIPAGGDNKFEPGPENRGQPTYFLPRRQSWLFRVQVPADWGAQKELVWTINAHDHPEKAYAQLLPDYELTERIMMTRGNLNPGVDDPNQPPTLALAPVTPASVANPLTLTAMVTDDGLPKPRAPKKTTAAPGAQANNSNGAARVGLSVSWMQFGGPAKIAFEPAAAIPIENGQASATARFTEPGTYVLRATATDSALGVSKTITVTVK